MDWGDVSKFITGLAPMLGTALGGPLGGIAGKVLADALDVEPTPAAVAAAVQNATPEQQAAIAGAEIEWAKTAATFATASATQSTAINETIRAEIAGAQPWWHWRNLLGYVVVTMVASFAVSVFKDLWLNDFHGVNASIQLTTAITPIFFGLLALLGYVAQDSTRLKTTAMTGQHPETIVGQIVKTIAGKR